MENFKYKNSRVRCSTSTCEIEGHLRRCPICGDFVKKGETYTWIHSNAMSFPDVVTHRDCFEENRKEITSVFKKIEEEYEKYKTLSSVF